MDASQNVPRSRQRRFQITNPVATRGTNVAMICAVPITVASRRSGMRPTPLTTSSSTPAIVSSANEAARNAATTNAVAISSRRRSAAAHRWRVGGGSNSTTSETSWSVSPSLLTDRSL